MPKTKHEVMAYLSTEENTLYVVAKHRRELAKILQVEKPAEREWTLPQRGYAVSVAEVRALTASLEARLVKGSRHFKPKEGDVRICRGCDCTKRTGPASKPCTPVGPDSLGSQTSYDYIGYVECAPATGKTCWEVYGKIGEFHNWNFDCTKTWADLPVYKWMCAGIP